MKEKCTSDQFKLGNLKYDYNKNFIYIKMVTFIFNIFFISFF